MNVACNNNNRIERVVLGRLFTKNGGLVTTIIELKVSISIVAYTDFRDRGNNNNRIESLWFFVFHAFALRIVTTIIELKA